MSVVVSRRGLRLGSWGPVTFAVARAVDSYGMNEAGTEPTVCAEDERMTELDGLCVVLELCAGST